MGFFNRNCARKWKRKQFNFKYKGKRMSLEGINTDVTPKKKQVKIAKDKPLKIKTSPRVREKMKVSLRFREINIKKK